LKKIAVILTLFIGLILLSLNHYRNYEAKVNAQLNPKMITPEVKQIEGSENSFDVTWINLPSIFDALIRSLKN